MEPVDFCAVRFVIPHLYNKRYNLPIVPVYSGSGTKRLVICVHYWCGSENTFRHIAKCAGKESTVIRLCFPSKIINRNIEESIKTINELFDKAVQLIDNNRKKYQEVVLVGASFGSNAVLKLATLREVDKIVLNTFVGDFTKNLLTSKGLNTVVRLHDEKGLCDDPYEFISADKTLDGIKGNPEFYVTVSKKDYFIPKENYENALKKLKSLPVRKKIYTERNLGHILTIYKHLLSSAQKEFIFG